MATVAPAASTALSSSRHTAVGHRQAFEKFVRENFLEQRKAGSKVITKSRGDDIAAYLTGAGEMADAHFKFWVKSRGFRVMDYPALGLKSVLCLPAKTKVLVNLISLIANRILNYYLTVG